jgi:hypothetical protein
MMIRYFFIILMLLYSTQSIAADITYADKTAGGAFTAADANEIKAAVNSKLDAVGEAELSISTGATGFKITSDPVRVPTAPVTIFRPTAPNSTFVLDLWPSSVNGDTPPNAFEGHVKFDMVDRDLDESTDPTQFKALMLSINSSSAIIGTHSGGEVLMPPPITFRGPNTGNAFTFTTTGPGATSQVAQYQMSSDSFGDTAGNFQLWAGGTGFAGHVFTRSPIHLKDDMQINWWNSGVGMTAFDTGLVRASAGVLKITDGATGLGVLQAGGGSAGKAMCWKADGKTLGYCSSAVDSGGGCTCN